MAQRLGTRNAPSARHAPGGTSAPVMTAAEVTGRLKKAGKVTLDSNGNGTVTLGPDNAWQRWDVTGIVVKTSQSATSTPVPQAEVFVNATTSPANSEGATSSGNNDTFNGATEVGPADNLNIVWSGGISGSVATAIVTGTRYTRRA